MIRTHPHRVRGVIFDLDGTLTVPMLDFAAIRREVGLEDASVAILEYLETLPEMERRRRHRILERHEAEAAARGTLSSGAAELFEFLRRNGVKTGLVTRNSPASVETFCQKHGISFDVVVTREDAPPKPSPEPLLLAAGKLGLAKHEVIYVGDFEMDRLTGEAAGVATYIVQHYPKARDNGSPDMRLENLRQVMDIVRGGGAE